MPPVKRKLKKIVAASGRDDIIKKSRENTVVKPAKVHFSGNRGTLNSMFCRLFYQMILRHLLYLISISNIMRIKQMLLTDVIL